MNETLERCRRNLVRRGFEARIAATTEEARQILWEKIRADPAMPRPQKLEIRRQGLLADLFITGINAVTEDGALLWLDMIGNRIAPIAFGPRKVLLVVGRNKITPTREAAEERIRTIAAPQNIARHPGFRTPCAVTGVCADCYSEDRICNTHLRMERCFPRKRITVVLIDEDLGL